MDITRADEIKLGEILKKHNAERCSNGHKIGFGDIAWNCASTEAGTDFSTVDIICTLCGLEVVLIRSWYPWIETADELLSVIESDWPDY